MNLFQKSCIATLFALLLVGCANQDKRATVVMGNKGQVDKIKRLDVVLEMPGYFSDPRAREALTHAKWDSGVFAKKFIDRLALKFMVRDIEINNVDSKWGVPQKYSIAEEPVNDAVYKMVIVPTNISYTVMKKNGNEYVMDTFTFQQARVIVIKSGIAVWEARENIVAGPVGANQFSFAVLNALDDYGFLEAKSKGASSK